MNRHTVEIVKEVRTLLSDEKHWIQRDYARDSAGKSITSISPDAVCWCLQGALNRVTSKDNPKWYEDYQEIYKDFCVFFPQDSIICFNDDPKRKHSEVIERLDSIIESLGHAENVT